MSFLFTPLRRVAVAAGLCLGAWSVAGAQTSTLPLRAALDAAWARTPTAQAQPQRAAELRARHTSTLAWWSGPPTLSLAHRNDRFGTRVGQREVEAELSLPLWNPGVRQAAQGQVQADAQGLEDNQALARLQLAGALREALGQLHTREAEHQLASRQRDHLAQLSTDTQKRVHSGDLPRVNLLQAQAALHSADIALSQAETARAQAWAQWRSLTGLDPWPALEDEQATDTITDAPTHHPALRAAQALVQRSQARLALVDAERRGPLELGLGMTRERSASGAPADTTVRVALRIPLGITAGHAAQRAAAQAELDAAEAEAAATARQVATQQASARQALQAARQQQTLAHTRAELAAQVQDLVTRAYQLGETDLPTRLRVDADRHEADLALARARIDTRRAIATLHQTQGLLP